MHVYLFSLVLVTHQLVAGVAIVARDAASDAASKAVRCASSNGSSVEPGLYKERLRPQIHYTPSTNFMNDPNGMFYANGTYHLYAQYNPTANVAGNQHWLHATSPDMYTWTNQPIALAPDKEGEGIYSGSAVVDRNNTSGFFNDSVAPEARVVAIYTLHTEGAAGRTETQDIAYSSDGGYTFTKYENNPVINLKTDHFRDPNVQWHEPSGQWIMTVALPTIFKVVFYGSPNLRTWTELSRFGEVGIVGLQYECPDLVEVPIEGSNKKKWVLIININPGMPLGGGGTVYFIGEFDGTKFTPDNGISRITEFAKDSYAGITYKGVSWAPGGHPLMVAWASNWQYTNLVPTSPWRSSQTIARKLTIKTNKPSAAYEEYVLAQEPFDTTPIQGETLYTQSTPVTENKTISLSGDGAFDFDFTFNAPGNISADSRAVITISNSDGSNSFDVGADFANSYIYIDRAKAGTWYNPAFNDKFSVGLWFPGGPQSIQLRGIVDRNVLELFAQNGTQVATSLFFFDEGQPATLSYKLGSGLQVSSATVQALNSVWDC